MDKENADSSKGDMIEPSKCSIKTTVDSTSPSIQQNSSQKYVETLNQPSREQHLSEHDYPLKSNSALSASPPFSNSLLLKKCLVDDVDKSDMIRQQDSFQRDNNKPAAEWTFYPSSCNQTYHTGKRCLFHGIHLRTNVTTTERSLETCMGKKRYVNESSIRNDIPVIMLGDHPYASPEESTDFYKKGSTIPPVNFGSSRYKKKSDTFIPLQHLPSISSVPFRIKEKQQELEREQREVRNLEKWQPAPSLMQTLFGTRQL